MIHIIFHILFHSVCYWIIPLLSLYDKIVAIDRMPRFFFPPLETVFVLVWSVAMFPILILLLLSLLLLSFLLLLLLLLLTIKETIENDKIYEWLYIKNNIYWPVVRRRYDKPTFLLLLTAPITAFITEMTNAMNPMEGMALGREHFHGGFGSSSGIKRTGCDFFLLPFSALRDLENLNYNVGWSNDL